MKENPNVFASLLTKTDDDPTRLLKYYVHPKILFHHVPSRQDDRKNKKDINLQKQLNI